MGWSNEATIIVHGQKVIILLELESTRGSTIMYLGYVEVNLQIWGIEGYNEDVLLLVIPTMTCSEKVPVMVGSKVIDRAMGMIIKGELVMATVIWKQVHFSALQFLRNPLWMMSRTMSVPQGGSPFLHFESSTFTATHAWGHCMCIHVVTEPALGPQLPTSMVPTATCGELHLCSSQVQSGWGT